MSSAPTPDKLRAFVFAPHQPAIATHAEPIDGYQPMLTIFQTAGQSIPVIGVDALRQLRAAVDFALQGAATPTA